MAIVDTIAINGETLECADAPVRFSASHIKHFVVSTIDEMNNLLLSDTPIDDGAECMLVYENDEGVTRHRLYTLNGGKWVVTDYSDRQLQRWYENNYHTFVDTDLEKAVVAAIGTENGVSVSKINGEADTLTQLIVSGNTNIEYIHELDQFKNLVPKSGMFQNMPNLKEVIWRGKSQPFVGAVSNLLSNCNKLEYADLTGLDMSQATSFSWLFNWNHNAEDFVIDVTGWDTSKVTSMVHAFRNMRFPSKHPKSKIIGMENWNTSSLTNLTYAFFQNNLEKIDISGWDVSHVTNMTVAFASIFNVHEFILPANSKTSSCTDFFRCFYFTNELREFTNFESIDVSNATRISGFFQQCWQLQKVDLSHWDTSKVTTDVTNFMAQTWIETLIGDHTLEEVENGTITIFKNLKVNLELNQFSTLSFAKAPLNRASILAAIKGVADLTGQASKYIKLDRMQYDRLTEEDIQLAASKNWTFNIVEWN